MKVFRDMLDALTSISRAPDGEFVVVGTSERRGWRERGFGYGILGTDGGRRKSSWKYQASSIDQKNNNKVITAPIISQSRCVPLS